MFHTVNILPHLLTTITVGGGPTAATLTATITADAATDYPQEPAQGIEIVMSAAVFMKDHPTQTTHTTATLILGRKIFEILERDSTDMRVKSA